MDVVSASEAPGMFGPVPDITNPGMFGPVPDITHPGMFGPVPDIVHPEMFGPVPDLIGGGEVVGAVIAGLASEFAMVLAL